MTEPHFLRKQNSTILINADGSFVPVLFFRRHLRIRLFCRLLFCTDCHRLFTSLSSIVLSGNRFRKNHEIDRNRLIDRLNSAPIDLIFAFNERKKMTRFTFQSSIAREACRGLWTSVQKNTQRKPFVRFEKNKFHNVHVDRGKETNRSSQNQRTASRTTGDLLCQIYAIMFTFGKRAFSTTMENNETR